MNVKENLLSRLRLMNVLVD